MNRPEGGPPEPSSPRRDLAVALFLGEATAVLIALFMPLTPSKTGSRWTPAEWFWAEPSYLQKAVVYYLLIHALTLAIVVTVLVVRGLRR